MDDREIINLYFKRDEKAIEETAFKYGNLCFSVAKGLLSDLDASECVNDTYLAACNSIPPQIPLSFSAFLLKITRRLSIDKFRKNTAHKRGFNDTPLILSELSESIVETENTETKVEQKLLSDAINRFVKSLPKTQQKVFIQRYWYMDSIESISKAFGFTEGKTKSMLFRIRQKLREYLIKEDLM